MRMNPGLYEPPLQLALAPPLHTSPGSHGKEPVRQRSLTLPSSGVE